MTSSSNQINQMASGDFDADELQEKIKAQKQPQAAQPQAAQPSAETGLSPSAKPYIAPRTPTEKWLTGTVAEWLGLERVGVDDDFFELGGDSIKALRILARVRDEFQVELPQSVLFSVQFTAAEMAKVIDQHQLESVSDEELAALMDELNELSDEDAKAQLDDEK